MMAPLAPLAIQGGLLSALATRRGLDRLSALGTILVRARASDLVGVLANGAAIANMPLVAGSGTVDQTVVGSRPTLNTDSLAAVRGGASKYLNISGVSLQSRAATMLMVVKSATPSSWQLLGGIGTTAVTIEQLNGGFAINRIGQHFFPGLTTPATYCVVGMRTEADGGVSVVLNGRRSRVYADATGSNHIASATLTSGYLGTSGFLSNYFTGDWLEVLLYGTRLTDAGFDEAVSLLATQYGIVYSAPSYQVVCDGNSLMAGQLATRSCYDAALPLLPGTCRGVNVSYSGKTTLQMTAQATSVDPPGPDPFYAATLPGLNILAAWEITNDISTNGVDGPTAYAHYVTYCQARRAVGFKVVAMTVLPRTQPVQATFDAARASANSSIRANWPTFADELADVASDVRIGDDGDNLDTTYYQNDHTHLTGAGQTIVGSIMAGAISKLLPGASDAYRAAILATPDLWGYWRLDETSGLNAVDASGAGRTATYTASGLTYGQVPGVPGTLNNAAIKGDGLTGQVTLPIAGLGVVLSAEMWFKPTSLSTTRYLYVAGAAGGSNRIEIGQFGATISVRDNISGTSVQTPDILTLTEFVHIVYTQTGSGAGTGHLYVNGVDYGTLDGHAGASGYARHNFLQGENASLFCPGFGDEVAVYLRALTVSEIANHYNAGRL